MNKTNYKQYDTRWAKLPYPKKPYYIKDCGCGEVSICNCIIEMDKYKNETPKTIQPYCKQYAAPNGDGAYFAGIPKMMKHYGMTEAKEHQTMGELWKELKKGNRVAIYLMGNRKGGSKKVHWTSSAHFVCSVGYKVKDGKHYVYMKDSNSTSSLRNGWISYEENLRNDVSRVWSGKLPAKAKKEQTLVDKELEACKEQAEWSKNAKYSWESDPTVEKSKKKQTCVTFVACVLQRIKRLKSGQHIWHDKNGKVTHATKDMEVIYPKNKTLKQYRDKLKAGDIVMAGDKHDVGGGSHIFILTGKWSKDGDPYIYDNHSAERVKKGKKPAHTYDGDKKIIAVVRPKEK